MAKHPLEQPEPGLVRCPDCGWEKRTQTPPEKVGHMCRPAGAHNRPEVLSVEISGEEKAAKAAALVEAASKVEELIEPGLVAKGFHWTKALIRWAAAGFPVRTDAEVVVVMDFCEHDGQGADHEPCPAWNVEESRCKLCGCNASRDGWAWRNKAKMATEHCHAKEHRW